MLFQATVLIFLAVPARCWDSFGHQTVGFLAQKYFTVDANATFSALVGLQQEFDIGDAAAWADTIRDKDNLPWSKNWHFISLCDTYSIWRPAALTLNCYRPQRRRS